MRIFETMRKLEQYRIEHHQPKDKLSAYLLAQYLGPRELKFRTDAS